ncbi:DUF6685 family protein [Aeromonas taiwanensis]|uniref:DUF6685 family protein n=1 Tax=Aeromonas dhakensis TaxID=196024 RepID=UPI002377F704|nr:DUF6685 family protein [Aeromonas dhakensis]MDD9212845.1 hypothetical protein [Aeromonas dhakensis]
MLTTAVRFIQHQLGHPARLHALLATDPALGYDLELLPSVSTDSITRWHEWRPAGWNAQPGELRGWARVNGQYQGHAILNGALATFCEQAQFEDWACDIRQVQVLSASKSPLEDFTDLDAFAEARCRGHLDDASPANIARNLAHGEVRIMQPGRGDYFLFHGWDGRICLINSGGSHHFATARYLAGVARQPVELTGMLKGYLLNPAAVTALTDEYELFAITRDPLIWDELFESMRALQATWFAGDLPRPHREGRALLLPRDDRHSMTVASVLRQTGVPDLGSYLQRQVHRQHDYPVGGIMAGCHG